MKRTLPILISLFCLVSGGFAQTTPAPAIAKATAYFEKTFSTEKSLGVAINALRLIKDPAAMPIIQALMESPEKTTRLIATVSAEDIAGQAAAPALLERLWKDPSMAVRVRALIQLIAMDSISVTQLKKACQIDDIEIRMNAAQGLIRKGQPAMAVPTLRLLVRRGDSDSTTFARLALLGAGDTSQIGELRKVVLDKKTPSSLFLRMLLQIRQESIKEALSMVEFLTGEQHARDVRLSAYMTLLKISKNPAPVIYQAIAKSNNPRLRAQLLNLLADAPFSKKSLELLAKESSLVGKLSQFELARAYEPAKISQVLGTILATAHPFVVDYILGRFQEDLKDKKKAPYYVQPLLKYVTNVPLDRSRITVAHNRVARAIQMLGDLGSRSALEGLQKILRHPRDNSTLKNIAAGALFRCNNPHVVILLKPLLKSDYPALKNYAALVLAKFNDKAAIPHLLVLQKTAGLQEESLISLTNWYLLRLAGQTRPAASQIATYLRNQ